MNIFFTALLLLWPQTSVPVDVIVPSEMPVRLEVTRDPEMNKLHVKRVFLGEIISLEYITYMQIGGVEEKRSCIFTARLEEGLAESGSVAWADSADVRRIVIIVERVETKAGVWRLDVDRDTVLARMRDGEVPHAVFEAR